MSTDKEITSEALQNLKDAADLPDQPGRIEIIASSALRYAWCQLNQTCNRMLDAGESRRALAVLDQIWSDLITVSASLALRKKQKHVGP